MEVPARLPDFRPHIPFGGPAPGPPLFLKTPLPGPGGEQNRQS